MNGFHFASCLILSLALTPSLFADQPWYEKCLVGMEVGPTGAQWGSDPRDTGYAASFSGADIVAKQIELGSEYLVLWGRDSEWAYYNSALMPKCPGLGDRDPLREAVDTAKPHNLPLIVYCVVQAGGSTLENHPEFAMTGLDRNVIPGRVCLNGPYRDFVKGLLAEMIAYGIDGFHIDMIDQGFGPPYGCCCEHCQTLFKTKYGSDMPTAETWDEAWDRMLAFRYDTSADFERDVYAFIKAKAPNISVDFNYHGYPPFSFEVGQRPVQHAHIGDFVTCESGVWGFSALNAGLTAEFVRATAPEKVYQVVMQRGARFYHDQTSRPLNDLRWEMFALLAHGSQVTIVDKTPFSGAIDPVAYERVGSVLQEVQRKQEHFGQTPVYDAGLYYSARSRDWYGRGQKEKYQQPFFGAHKALTYAHIPTAVVLDENVSAESLRALPVVVLPNATILSADEIGLFTEYVRGGGNLIVTGQTGCYDRYGNATSASAMESLIGAKLVRLMPDNDNYFRLTALPAELAALAQDIPQDWPLLMYGPASVYEPTTAMPLGDLVAPIRRQRQLDGKEGTSFPSSAGEAVGPGVLINAFGEGRVITFAVSPDGAAGSEYRTLEARTLLANAVRLLRPKPLVAIDAPEYVETVVTDDAAEKCVRIHFLSYAAPPGMTEPKRPWILPELMKDAPMFRARVHASRPLRGVEKLNANTALNVRDDAIEVVIDDVHEVLLLQYE